MAPGDDQGVAEGDGEAVRDGDGVVIGREDRGCVQVAEGAG